MSLNEQGDFVSDSFCSKLTTDEARELAETLSGHLGPGLTKWGLTYRLAEPVIEDLAEDLAPSLSIEPYLPHGQTQGLGADERNEQPHRWRLYHLGPRPGSADGPRVHRALPAARRDRMPGVLVTAEQGDL